MSVLLDTNIVIALINDSSPHARSQFRCARTAKKDMLLSSVVVHELWFGVLTSAKQMENADRLRTFLAGGFRALDFDDDDALRAAEIRAALKRKGRPIGPYDLLIAAQALRAAATLVTANMQEFRSVPGLKLDNWLEQG